MAAVRRVDGRTFAPCHGRWSAAPGETVPRTTPWRLPCGLLAQLSTGRKSKINGEKVSTTYGWDDNDICCRDARPWWQIEVELLDQKFLVGAHLGIAT